MRVLGTSYYDWGKPAIGQSIRIENLTMEDFNQLTRPFFDGRSRDHWIWDSKVVPPYLYRPITPEGAGEYIYVMELSNNEIAIEEYRYMRRSEIFITRLKHLGGWPQVQSQSSGFVSPIP